MKSSGRHDSSGPVPELVDVARPEPLGDVLPPEPAVDAAPPPGDIAGFRSGLLDIDENGG
jgi:hypothetical protein